MIGLVLGVASGVFFGERATLVDPVGRGFVRLLQMSVIPYVALSLIAGLGRLDTATARDLALRGGAVLVVMWAVALGAVSLFGLALPTYETASFFSTALAHEAAQVDLLGLYIPANPFEAMVDGIMPAIVLFSIFLGVAMIAVPSRSALVEQLSTMADALLKLNEYVVGLAPYGVFALMASAAGTITPEELERLQVFVVTFAGIALLMALWVLPALVACVTPLRYRDVVLPSRDALVTAFATGSLLIVLPILASQSRKLSPRPEGASPDAPSVSDIVVPVSFNFPSTGKLLTLSFIVFGGWLSGNELGFKDIPVLLGVGTFTFFAPNAVAVPFMLDLFQLPSDLFGVFLGIDVVTGRFGVLVAAMHVLCIAVLVSFAIERKLEIRKAALLRWAAISAAGLVALLVGARLFFATILDLDADTYEVFVEMELRGEPVKIVDSEPHDPDTPVLRSVRESGVLRVCYGEHALPFAYVNASSDLVGYDVEAAHDLARDLDAGLHFVRATRGEIAEHLALGNCDIAMTGMTVLPERVEHMRYTRPYLDNTLAFIVEDYQRHRWQTWDDIRARKSPRIAIPPSDHYVRLLETRIPHAEIGEIDNPRPFFRKELEDLDAFAFSGEAGGAWTLIYPSFSVVVPQPDPVNIPLAYAVPKGQPEWLDYMNAWVELKRADHSLTRHYEYWMLGLGAEERKRALVGHSRRSRLGRVKSNSA
jgi:Na+/H+-dicarboxylate symporter